MGGVNVDNGGKGGRRSLDTEINMIPMIDLLMVTISFLLITAVWIVELLGDVVGGDGAIHDPAQRLDLRHGVPEARRRHLDLDALILPRRDVAADRLGDVDDAVDGLRDGVLVGHLPGRSQDDAPEAPCLSRRFALSDL